MSKFGTRCRDCDTDTFDPTNMEYYMVHDSVWCQQARMKYHGGMLCVGCLEARIGRRLTPKDFTKAILNSMVIDDERTSSRLLSRLLVDSPEPWGDAA